MEPTNDQNEKGLAILCDRTGKVLEIFFDGFGITKKPEEGFKFTNVVDEESIHKADNFFGELVNQNMAYNWELNATTSTGPSPLKFSGVSWGQHFLIVAAPSNFEMSKILEQFIHTKNPEENKGQSLKDIAELSCEQEQRDRELFDEIAHLNNELVNVQRELAKKNAELVQLNQNLEKHVDERTEKINHLLQQKDDFIVQLGHDLKTPLGPIINLVPIIEKKEQDNELKEMLSIVKKSSNKLHNLVKNTMKYAYVTSREFSPNLEEIQINEVISTVLIPKKEELEKREIELINRVNLDRVITTDKNLLNDIFNELLSNAMKFSSNGGTIILENELKDDMVQFSVHDNGIGLTEQQIKQVFDEFYKADESRHDLSCHGLGLPIIKNIIERLGGTIEIDSAGIDTGSTVTFTLPLNYKEQQYHEKEKPKDKL
jgi:signal transduction histidine kinase